MTRGRPPAQQDPRESRVKCNSIDKVTGRAVGEEGIRMPADRGEDGNGGGGRVRVDVANPNAHSFVHIERSEAPHSVETSQPFTVR